MATEKKLVHLETLSDDSVITRQFNSYVCLSVNVGGRSKALPPLYWRLVDAQFNLVEIGIGRDSGSLESVKVVLYRGALYRMAPEQLDSLIETTAGLPRFSLDLWSLPGGIYDVDSDYYDVPGRCKLEVAKTKLRVSLFPDRVAYRVAKPGLECEFNQSSELCAILVDNLDSQEILALKKYIKLYNGTRDDEKSLAGR